jgi:hypothetical protein
MNMLTIAEKLTKYQKNYNFLELSIINTTMGMNMENPISLMKSDKKKRVTIILNLEIYNDLVKIAESESRSLTSLVTHAVLKYIKDFKNSN